MLQLIFSCIYLSPVQCKLCKLISEYISPPRNGENFICAPQFMLTSGGPLRIIYIFYVSFWWSFKNYLHFFTQMCTKTLVNICASFGKIIWLSIYILYELNKDHELRNLISEPINPTGIDNNLRNKKTRFIKTLTFDIGIPDHLKVIGTMPRSVFIKEKPNNTFHRFCKNFDNEKFEEDLKIELLSVSDFE